MLKAFRIIMLIVMYVAAFVFAGATVRTVILADITHDRVIFALGVGFLCAFFGCLIVISHLLDSPRKPQQAAHWWPL